MWLQLPGGQSWGSGEHLDRDNRLGHWPLPMLTLSNQGRGDPRLSPALLLDLINEHIISYKLRFVLYFTLDSGFVIFSIVFSVSPSHPPLAKEAPLTYLIYCDGLPQNQIKDVKLLGKCKRLLLAGWLRNCL